MRAGVACEYRCPWKPEVIDPLKTQLRVFVNHLMWILETEPRSSTKVVQALNY